MGAEPGENLSHKVPPGIFKPPYIVHNLALSHQPLGNKTLAVSAAHYDGTLEYDVHNLYGLSMALATHAALVKTRQKRPFLLTRYEPAPWHLLHPQFDVAVDGWSKVACTLSGEGTVCEGRFGMLLLMFALANFTSCALMCLPTQDVFHKEMSSQLLFYECVWHANSQRVTLEQWNVRSTWLGSGAVAAKWTGDTRSSWADLRNRCAQGACHVLRPTCPVPLS